MRRPRRTAATAAFLVVLAVPATGCGSETEVATLPEVTLAELDGPGMLDLSTVRGPAVINLWASWCGPCREELPVAEAFHQEHGDEVTMLGVDFQDVQVAQARRLAEESGLSYEQLADPDGLLDGAAPFPPMQGLPFWAFVDADGHVVHLEFVVIESVAQLEALVEEHLAVAL